MGKKRLVIAYDEKSAQRYSIRVMIINERISIYLVLIPQLTAIFQDPNLKYTHGLCTPAVWQRSWPFL